MDSPKVLMLSWEYPPRIVGGVSRHMKGLCESLAKQGVDVHVVTMDYPGAPREESNGGLHIHRIGVEVASPNFSSWVLLMNHYLGKRVGDLWRAGGGFDIVHAHDWLTACAGIEARHSFGAPLVVTIHSLEDRRAGGINSPESRMIDGLEWWATYEAQKLIVCSNSMKRDVVNHFRPPESKVWVIPNGIDPSAYEREVSRWEVRARYGIRADEKLILFIGRLAPQKGVEFLIRAIPKISARHNVRLLIVGEGGYRGYLEGEAAASGQSWRIRFVGFISDEESTRLMKAADVMVIPSVYEPFGVVALEGMSAKIPLVVSNIDGLSEFIRHEHNGIHVYPRDPSSIAWGVDRVLSDPALAAKMTSVAHEEIRRMHSWERAAALTLDLYRSILAPS